jgi:metaxin
VPLYCSSTSVGVVQSALARSLRSAAEAELKKTRPGAVLVKEDIYADAAAAWEALSQALADNEWFLGAKEPGVLDAAVFAYSHLLLKLEWDQAEDGVRRSLERWENLVQHERRVRERCGW